jgi:chemotaxis protein MotB
LIVSLPQEAAFATGSTEPSAEARDLISRVAAAVAPTRHAIRIEGHTDNVPIRTARYASNWELSTARASAVVAFLVESQAFDPRRLSAAGYGEFHPRVPNDTSGNRARNRRIDIVILDGGSTR